MTDVLWPPDLAPASQQWGILGNVGVFQSPLSGAVRTYSRPGSRLRCTITLPPINSTNRARMIALLSALRDQSNRIWVPDFTVSRAGSFSAPELFTNNDFSNGTTGWTTGNASLAVQDRVARLTYNGGVGSQPLFYQSVAATQYAPYALRSHILEGAQSSGLSLGVSLTRGTASMNNYSTSRGLVSIAAVVDSASAQNQFPVAFSTASGYSAGAYVDCQWASYARCALGDIGSNLLLQSDAFGTSWSVTRSTVTSNSVVSPDGTTTADTLNEDGSAATNHFISQDVTVAAAVADYTFSCSVKVGTRTWVCLQINESVSGHSVQVFANLSSGVLGTVAVSGANWTNPRAFIVAEGNGWYRVHIVCRKASAATTLTNSVVIAEADNDVTFSGGSAASLYLWRAVLAQSSVPVRGAQTTTTAAAGTSQTGSSIYLKGLPASTSGLLRVGDPVQLGNQMNFCTAPLDTDAAGKGLLQVGNPWRVSVADNDPVFVNTPMALMRVAGDMNWDTMPARFSGFQLELVEDVT